MTAARNSRAAPLLLALALSGCVTVRSAIDYDSGAMRLAGGGSIAFLIDRKADQSGTSLNFDRNLIEKTAGFLNRSGRKALGYYQTQSLLGRVDIQPTGQNWAAVAQALGKVERLEVLAVLDSGPSRNDEDWFAGYFQIYDAASGHLVRSCTFAKAKVHAFDDDIVANGAKDCFRPSGGPAGLGPTEYEP